MTISSTQRLATHDGNKEIVYCYVEGIKTLVEDLPFDQKTLSVGILESIPPNCSPMDFKRIKDRHALSVAEVVRGRITTVRVSQCWFERFQINNIDQFITPKCGEEEENGPTNDMPVECQAFLQEEEGKHIVKCGRLLNKLNGNNAYAEPPSTVDKVKSWIFGS
ncbi:MAG: hypothetical protein ACSNEK_09645 [Parachlamydiaceae bacterium]